MSEHIHKGTVHRLCFQHEPFGVRFWVTGIPSNPRLADGMPGKYSAHMVGAAINSIHRVFGPNVIVTVH